MFKKQIKNRFWNIFKKNEKEKYVILMNFFKKNRKKYFSFDVFNSNNKLTN